MRRLNVAGAGASPPAAFTGMPRAPARRSPTKPAGLRWLSVQLLARVPWAHKIWGLPFLTALAPSARYYQARGRQPQNLTARAKQVILQVKRWAPKRPMWHDRYR